MTFENDEACPLQRSQRKTAKSVLVFSFATDTTLQVQLWESTHPIVENESTLKVALLVALRAKAICNLHLGYSIKPKSLYALMWSASLIQIVSSNPSNFTVININTT